MREYPALGVLSGFVRGGSFLKSYNLGVQEWVFRPLLQFVEVRDLFLRPKCLLEAPWEHQGAIVDSLCIVRCRCMVIFRVLG